MFMDGAEEKTEHSIWDEINTGDPYKGCGWITFLYYHSVRSVFTLTRRIIIVFPKNEFV
jgi:hypothetical protein